MYGKDILPVHELFLFERPRGYVASKEPGFRRGGNVPASASAGTREIYFRRFLEIGEPIQAAARSKSSVCPTVSE